MTIESATKLLYDYKPIVEDRGQRDERNKIVLEPIPFDEARARYAELIAVRRELARRIAKEIGRPDGVNE